MNNDIPESVIKVVQQAAAKYATDIPKAVQVAVGRIRELSDYDSFVDALVYNSVQELVYDARHKTNVETKRQTGYYSEKSGMKVGVTPATNELYKSVYDYNIAGTILGNVRGVDLDEIIESEEGRARGHQFNADLGRWLKTQGVVGEKRVKEVVPERKLRINFDRIYKNVMSNAG